MKKIIAMVSILVCFWMMFSFLDVVSDNKSENPKHSDLNFFVLIAPEEETEPAELREVWAEVTEINQEAESITLADENGKEWIAFADVEIYAVGDEVMVVFDNMATDDWYDDEIVDLVKW
jgi:hypothetical protein